MIGGLPGRNLFDVYEEENMGQFQGRAMLRAGGLFLFLLVVLFSLTLNQAHAYPAPKFQYAYVFSSQDADGPITTIFFAIISGPSPEDVASFTATGPSGTFTLTANKSFRELGLYYADVEESIVSNGAYTFQVTDTSGNSASVVRDFTYDGTLQQVDASTMLPVDGTYVGTTTPTLSFDPVTGPVYYSVQVWDCDGKAIWYTSPKTTATSFNVPSGLLQPNTAYMWRARVWDRETNPQNLRQNHSFFYTGTKADPVLNAGGVLSLPVDGGNLLNFGWARGVNVAPWDINHFNATGPDSTVFNLAASRGYGFQFPAINQVLVYLNPPTQSVPDGTYTVEIADNSGHSATSTFNYAYNPVPDFSADTRVPADNAYFDTETPSFSWARVTGDAGDGSYRYSVRVTDYLTGIRWYDSPYSSDTWFTLPENLNLPRGSSYKWRVNVYGPASGGGTNANNFRSSDYRTFTINSDHPSCPEIYSWNGEEYQFAGSLFTRTHSPESEFFQDQIISPVVPQGDTINFLIKEIDQEESYVNSVGMFYRYVWAPSDDWQSLPLLSAVHNRDGNVMESLLEKDDKRVYLIPGDEILVQYAFPPAGLGGIEFSSVASGYYLWSHETWCEVLALGRQLHVTPGDTVTLRAYINNMSTKVLPDDAIVRFALEDDPDTTVGSVSAAGLAPGDSQWYLLEWTTPEDFTAGAYSYRASIFLGESDITWKPEYYPTLPEKPATENVKGAACN